MDSDALADGAAGIAALAEPVRRSLYQFVSRQPEAVSREQAAAAVGVPAHTAKFHLERLVTEGLLDVEFRRLSGRSGPGAGRPSKLYRRSGREIEVSLPQRHYDLLGRILAEAVEQSIRTRVEVGDAAAEAARREGRAAGESGSRRGGELTRTAATLEQQGYEPRVDEGRLLLENCPFDRLARDHTELVCGLNLEYVEGVIEGLACHDLTAALEPNPARCCVVARVT
jgi:predicted ArsR family transcriptional regulator